MKGSNSLKVILGMLVLITVILTWIYGSNASENNVVLWKYDFSISARDDNIYFLDYEDPNEKISVVAITGISSSDAREYVSEKVRVFSALFGKHRSGYIGQQTDLVECNEKHKPKLKHKEVSAGIVKYFETKANSRFTLGICDSEDVVYGALNLYMLCHEADAVFEVEYFDKHIGGELSGQFLERLNCNLPI